MQRLPPYGKSLTNSQTPVWVFAGEKRHIFKYVRHFSPDTLAIYYWDDPENYRWPVQGRQVFIMCYYHVDELCKEYLKDHNYLERLALSLFLGGAQDIHIFNMANFETHFITRS